MVAATYASDLTDIALMESTTGIGDYGGGGGAASAGVDYAIEGTNCVDKQVNATERGFLFDNVSNFTIGADDHFYGWIVVGTYGLAATRNNRGVVFNIGDDTNNFVKFHVNGGDTLPFGGMLPYAIRFVNTALANFRTLVGTPGTTPSQIGAGANITGSAKFANLAMDAVRIGTGYDILNGTGADPEANFAGIATDDDVAKEGVLLTVSGGYSLQGKLRIGSASTACEFLDINTSVNLVDTRHSLTDFTEILVEHASSIVTLTNVTFNALGTNNPGRFEAITSAATIDLSNVSFINFGATVLGSGSTIIGSRWINAGQITQNGCTVSDSAIIESSSAISMVVDNLSLITGNTFTSDGSNYAVDLGNFAANIAVTWNNFESGYVAGTSGTGVDDKTPTGNETITCDVDSGFTLTINVATGASTPSVSNTGLGSVDVVVGQNTLSFTLNPSITGYEWRLYEASGTPGDGTIGTVELDGEEVATQDNQTYTYTYTADQPVAIQILANGYEEYLQYETLQASNKSFTFNLTPETNA